ncbi:MAG TPA: winged helix-turn-helix domain-containing protein [Puia sp.]|uniref:ArsR/SmtB family transcription factor n=1 Tax=Puia sp. TaxID=2045100 RepID=UPI002BD8E878|nr:winged helix-turn-helix domain-containing protein [Puia sp.]HVU98288.1 winged helix-turn-helix domain-containing protein [Puia sp.]
MLKDIAQLIGDPVRANILWTLLDGRAYTASELASAVDTSAPNCSMHLAKLIRADLLTVEAQGRHRYYTFSRPEVAYAVEALAALVPQRTREAAEKEDPPIRVCRTCYDHLAGRVGVQLTESLVKQKILTQTKKQYDPTPKGVRWFLDHGIDPDKLQQQRRHFARTCLDWTERRPHLAGSLGAALLQMMLDEQWLRRMPNTRAVMVTPKGRKALTSELKLEI